MDIRMPITDSTLRRAMRDDRYWRNGHPERPAYVAWVTEGYRAIGDATPGGGGMVFVRA